LPENKGVIYGIRRRKEKNNKQNYGRGWNLDEIKDKIKKLWMEKEKILREKEEKERKRERIRRRMDRMDGRKMMYMW